MEQVYDAAKVSLSQKKIALHVKICYLTRQKVWTSRGDIAFNELVKECLFVHGWRSDLSAAFPPLCITKFEC